MKRWLSIKNHTTKNNSLVGFCVLKTLRLNLLRISLETDGAHTRPPRWKERHRSKPATFPTHLCFICSWMLPTILSCECPKSKTLSLPTSIEIHAIEYRRKAPTGPSPMHSENFSLLSTRIDVKFSQRLADVCQRNVPFYKTILSPEVPTTSLHLALKNVKIHSTGKHSVVNAEPHTQK